MLSSSPLKITCHLHMWKGHYCYGMIYKSRLLQQKKIYINVKWCDLWNITCPLGDTKIWNFCEEKYFNHLFVNIPSEISYFQAAMYCKVLHVYIMYIDLFIHLSWLFTLYLIVDRQDVLLHILLLPTATHTAYSQYWDMVW